ncbi:hypothetical protein CYPRO_1978 [Cyclonatronum proteinivorum]|uniref:Uncharacterized protein n=1 Tax=Cyclonatronum proteinivorum TaxID=1457365 RepID=A0A345UL76_9BACT|nr:hypothetical protein CYPRO_1978 [Cyclonatronum proteinivorum]
MGTYNLTFFLLIGINKGKDSKTLEVSKTYRVFAAVFFDAVEQRRESSRLCA